MFLLLLLENFTNSDRMPQYIDTYISPIVSKLWKVSLEKSSPMREQSFSRLHYDMITTSSRQLFGVMYFEHNTRETKS